MQRRVEGTIRLDAEGKIFLDDEELFIGERVGCVMLNRIFLGTIALYPGSEQTKKLYLCTDGGIYFRLKDGMLLYPIVEAPKEEQEQKGNQ